MKRKYIVLERSPLRTTRGIPWAQELPIQPQLANSGWKIPFYLFPLIFSNILGEGFESGIDAVIECLLEAGIIVDREPLFLNGLDEGLRANGNVECTGDPICERIRP